MIHISYNYKGLTNWIYYLSKEIEGSNEDKPIIKKKYRTELIENEIQLQPITSDIINDKNNTDRIQLPTKYYHYLVKIIATVKGTIFKPQQPIPI